MGNKKIGILALQGGFEAHQEVLNKLGVPTMLVRRKEELEQCVGLIIPGGESTTISCLMKASKLEEPLYQFGLQKPVFGTCAGLIILARLGLMGVEVTRNAYGRQNDSFSTSLSLLLEGHNVSCSACFIRAPKITKLLNSKVQILSSHNNDPVLVEQNNILCATFHSELTEHFLLHAYFTKKCCL